MLARFDRRFAAINRTLVGILMIPMFLIVFTNVVARYGFGFSLSWGEEVARFLMVWVTFLGAGLALREGRLVAIELLQDRLGAPARRALRIALGGLILAFLGLLIVYGSQFVVFGWSKVTIATQIPRGIPYLAIPIGAAMFALHLVLTFGRFVARDWEEPDGHSLGPGAE